MNCIDARTNMCSCFFGLHCVFMEGCSASHICVSWTVRMSEPPPSTRGSSDSVGTWLWGAVRCIVRCLPASLAPAHSVPVECRHPLPQIIKIIARHAGRGQFTFHPPLKAETHEAGTAFSPHVSLLRAVPGTSMPQSRRRHRRDRI